MKKRIAFAAFIAIAVFIALFSVFCYPGDYYINMPSGTKLYEFNTYSITDSRDCVIKGNQIISDYSGDPYIQFSGFSTKAECMVIDMEWTDNGSDMLLYFDDETDLKETEYVFVHPNAIIDGKVYVKIPAGTEYKSLRLKAKSSYVLNSVQLYEKSNPVTVDIPISAARYIFVIAATLLVGIGVYFCDIKFLFAKKLCDYTKPRLKKYAMFFLGIVLAIGIGIAAEFLIFGVFEANPALRFFHYGRFAFIFALIAVASSFVLFLKDGTLVNKPEKFLLCVMLFVGTALIIGVPVGQCSWDVNRHYEWAHNASFFGTAYTTRADKLIYDMNWVAWPTYNRAVNVEHIGTLNEFGSMYLGTASASTKLPHLLSGVFIAVSRLFGATFYQQFLIGEFAILLIYSLLCYFAARKLKSGKMILSVIALLPTGLFMAANYSYDFWVAGFIMLGTAYFAAQLQDKEKGFSVKDTLIMCIAFVLACLPKLVYLAILLIPLVLRKLNFTKKNYKTYYAICLSSILLLAVLLVIRSVWSINSGGDTRGGAVDSKAQFDFILNNVFEYIKILFNFLLEYLSPLKAYKYITNFVHVGWGVFAPLFIVLIIFTTLTDKNEADNFKGKNIIRIASIVFFLLTCILMATAFYISFTEPASKMILGCQPRYIIPLLLPLLLFIANPGIRLNTKKWYNISVMSLLCFGALSNLFVLTVLNYY